MPQFTAKIKNIYMDGGESSYFWKLKEDYEVIVQRIKAQIQQRVLFLAALN